MLTHFGFPGFRSTRTPHASLVLPVTRSSKLKVYPDRRQGIPLRWGQQRTGLDAWPFKYKADQDPLFCKVS